jgi:hypothetical protein
MALDKADWHQASKTHSIGPADRIKLHVLSNPMAPGSMSAARFHAYRDGETVRDYLKRGGTREDLAHDRKRGHVTLHDPDAFQKLAQLTRGSPVAQINHDTASGRLKAIKVRVESESTT